MATTDQIPTNSGFHAKSTADEVMAGIDMTGKTVIVTGGYSGIGLETVRSLAIAGASVTVPVRSPDKAKETLADVQGDVQTAPMDLANLSSIRQFTDAFVESHTNLDLLINNAGIMACPMARVGPGWESQFGVNHMGHFALTMGLMPLLRATPDARVVALSSTAHKLTDILWDDVQ